MSLYIPFTRSKGLKGHPTKDGQWSSYAVLLHGRVNDRACETLREKRVLTAGRLVKMTLGCPFGFILFIGYDSVKD